MKQLRLYFFAFLCTLIMCVYTKVGNDATTPVSAKTQTSPKNAKAGNTDSANKKKSDDEDDDSDLIKPNSIQKEQVEYPSDEEAAYAEEEMAQDDTKFFATEARLQEYFNKPSYLKLEAAAD